jgi:hypothetical protein
MAYARRYNKTTRRSRKKPAWYNQKYSTMQIAQKAWKATKYLKGLVNSEMLHVDTSNVLGVNAGAIFHLTGIAQGDTDAGRTGNSLLLKNIYLRGICEINSAVTGDSRVLLALVKDTQQISDTTPALTDIFQNSTSTETMLKLNNSGRFKILWRKTYVLSIASGGRNALEINKYFKVYDHVRFNGSSSSDIQKNGYYLTVITSEVAANAPTVSITSRIGYHDN